MSWPADLFPSRSAADVFYIRPAVEESPVYVPPVPQSRIKEVVRKRAPVTEEFVATALPKIIIVGASLGGLMLAIILEMAGIPYRIFERAKVCEPLRKSIFLFSLSAWR